MVYLKFIEDMFKTKKVARTNNFSREVNYKLGREIRTYFELNFDANRNVVRDFHSYNKDTGKLIYDGPTFEYCDKPFTVVVNPGGAFNLESPVFGAIKHKLLIGDSKQVVFRGVIGYTTIKRALESDAGLRRLVDMLKIQLNEIVPRIYKELGCTSNEIFVGDQLCTLERPATNDIFREMENAAGFEWRLYGCGCAYKNLKEKE